MQYSTKQLIELIGIATVVLSLLLVAYEIRQSNEIATTANVNDVYARFSSVSEAILTDPELAVLLIKKQTAIELSELSMEEQVRLGGWVSFVFDIWVAGNIAYNNDQLSEVTYNTIFDDARLELGDSSGPAHRRTWRDFIDTYPSVSQLAIVKFINSELAVYESQGLIADAN